MIVKGFGKITSIITEFNMEIQKSISVKELNEKLEKEFPSLSNYKFLVAINKKIVSDYNNLVNNNDEIALLPPFSGG